MFVAIDGVTMLPTFMPVATQAAIKGLTSQQVESLGINLILNNTYHLNLRPGMKVLTEAGGAHKFQGWRHNLLTVILLENTSCGFDRLPDKDHIFPFLSGQRGVSIGISQQIYKDH